MFSTRRLAGVLVSCALVTVGAAQAQVTVGNHAFGQIDWYDSEGVLQIPDSSWGTLELDVLPHASMIHYYNVTADAGSGTAWIVQNMPLLPDIVGGSGWGRRGVDFDITLLGIPSGTDLPSLLFTDSVTPTPLTTAPVGPMAIATVETNERISFGSKLESPPLPPDVGVPMGMLAGTPSTSRSWPTFIFHKDVPAVQEGDSRCLAGAFARSIWWLDKKHKGGMGKTPQQIYDDLVAKRVGSSGPGATTYEQDIKSKADYLKDKLKGKTKVLDLNNAVGPVAGVKEETGTDVLDWLKRELPTEDVELHYDGHIITVTGFVEIFGNAYVRYRDDERQDNDSKGDSSNKWGKLKQNPDGSYSFRRAGGEFFKVPVLISESVETTVGVNSSPVVPTESVISCETVTTGETLSDVVYGDLGLLLDSGGDWAVGTLGCLANDEPGTTMVHAGVPPPGEALWFVQRSTNAGAIGSYDSLGLGQAGDRDDGIAATPFGCPSCLHDHCLVGAPLDPGCNTCVGQICDILPHCCAEEWDPLCVDHVQIVCGSVRCANSRGFCEHTLCSEGEPLFPGCDVPPLPTSCVADVCGVSPDCCGAEWNEPCVEAVGSTCGWACN